MKLTMTALCVAAAASWALSGSVQAQSGTGQSGQAGQSGSMHSQSSKASKVKLTGCLQADPSGNGYILTNVTEGEPSASSSYGSSSSGTTGSTTSGTTGSTTSGTTGSTTSGTVTEQSTPAPSNANSVELVGKSGELKTLVGQRIEVTGTPAGKSNKLDKSSSSSGTSGSSTSSSTSSSTTGTEQTGSEQTGSMSGSSRMGEGHWQGQKIRVDSVRQVASSCSGQ
jgi:hypothetical protein